MEGPIVYGSGEIEGQSSREEDMNIGKREEYSRSTRKSRENFEY
jgi:hypothetical protein